MRVLKCHGSANDFILVDLDDCPILPYGFGRFAREACDRAGPLGADGVLFVSATDGGAQMRIFNADGSEAEMCGNGLRCASRYICEHLGFESAVVRTELEAIETYRTPAIFDGVETYGYVSSSLSFEPESLPMIRRDEVRDELIPSISKSHRFTALSIPNPHLVAVVEKIDIDELVQAGKRAARDRDLFPRGVNVSFVEKIADGELRVATFERGVGLSAACGTAVTACCVVVSSASLDEGAEHSYRVFTNAGMVRVRVSGVVQGSEVRLEGNATFTYTAAVFAREDGSIDGVDRSRVAFIEEIEAYERFRSAALASIAD